MPAVISRRQFLPLSLIGGIALSTTGCGLAAQIMYTLKGAEEPAKFSGLKEKKVAVVCFDSNTLRGPGTEAETIAKIVSTKLGMKVKDIDLVRQAEISDWLDNQTQDVADFREVGRGVKADMVVGIDLKSFSIHEGATLLKGRASCAVLVYDMTKSKEPVYSADIQLNYPENGARHVTESESAFRTIFTDALASRIARDFYPYDRMDEYGKDAKFIGD